MTHYAWTLCKTREKQFWGVAVLANQLCLFLFPSVYHDPARWKYHKFMSFANKNWCWYFWYFPIVYSAVRPLFIERWPSARVLQNAHKRHFWRSVIMFSCLRRCANTIDIRGCKHPLHILVKQIHCLHFILTMLQCHHKTDHQQTETSQLRSEERYSQAFRSFQKVGFHQDTMCCYLDNANLVFWQNLARKYRCADGLIQNDSCRVTTGPTRFFWKRREDFYLRMEVEPEFELFQPPVKGQRLTFRFFRCPGVFAIAMVSFSSLKFVIFDRKTQLNYSIRSFIFMPTFPRDRVAMPADLGGLGIHCGQQQLQLILLAPHYAGAKQGGRCSHSTWSLDDLWAPFPWIYPAGLTAGCTRFNYFTIFVWNWCFLPSVTVKAVLTSE